MLASQVHQTTNGHSAPGRPSGNGPASLRAYEAKAVIQFRISMTRFRTRYQSSRCRDIHWQADASQAAQAQQDGGSLLPEGRKSSSIPLMVEAALVPAHSPARELHLLHLEVSQALQLAQIGPLQLPHEEQQQALRDLAAEAGRRA